MITPVHDDGTLLLRWVEQRDEAAFVELWRRYSQMVMATCLRATGGNAADAEDALQTVFATLAAQAGSVRDAAALGGWLHRTALRAVARQRRSATRRHAREVKTAQHAATSIDEPSDQETIRPHLNAAISALTPAQREAVIRHYLQSKPIALVATELRVSESAVLKRLQLGIERLRPLLMRRGVTIGATALLTCLSREAQAASSLTVPAAPSIAGVSALPSTTASGLVLAGVGTALVLCTAVSWWNWPRTETDLAPAQPTSVLPAPAPASVAQASRSARQLDVVVIPDLPGSEVLRFDHPGTIAWLQDASAIRFWQPGHAVRDTALPPAMGVVTPLYFDGALQLSSQEDAGGGAVIASLQDRGVQREIYRRAEAPWLMTMVQGRSPDGRIGVIDRVRRPTRPDGSLLREDGLPSQSLLMVDGRGAILEHGPVADRVGDEAAVWIGDAICGFSDEGIRWVWPEAGERAPIANEPGVGGIGHLVNPDGTAHILFAQVKPDHSILTVVDAVLPKPGVPGRFAVPRQIAVSPKGCCSAFDDRGARWSQAWIEQDGTSQATLVCQHGTLDSAKVMRWRQPLSGADQSGVRFWIVSLHGARMLVARLESTANKRTTATMWHFDQHGCEALPGSWSWAGAFAPLCVSGDSSVVSVRTEQGWVLFRWPSE